MNNEDTTLSQRAHRMKAALQTSRSAETPLSAHEAFIGHEFKGKAAKYTHNRQYLECSLTLRFRLMWLAVAIGFGPALTAFLIWGDKNPIPLYFLIMIWVLNALMWRFLIGMIRYDRRVIFDFEAGQAYFKATTLRTQYATLELNRIVGTTDRKFYRPKTEGKLATMNRDLETMPDSQKITCFCLLLRLNDNQQVNIMETTDARVVQEVKDLLDDKLGLQQ